MHKIGPSGGFLGILLGPLLKTGVSLMKKVLKTLVKSVLILLGLTGAASATNATIHKKMLGSGTTWINDIIKIVKSLEESGLSKKSVSETIQNEAKEEKGGFLSMLLGTLGASLLGNLLAGKGVMRAGEGTIRAGENV